MYIRKTEDEYIIQGFYGYGWEDLTTEKTSKEAKEQLKAYNQNETNYSHRIIKRRIKKEASK